MKHNATSTAADPYNLNRFLSAQEKVYDTAVAELRGGRKRTHWMWFIFPQFEGLAQSATSRHYAVKSRAEAKAYLNHAILGERLRECAEVLLAIENCSVSEIFGYPDDLKLKSSLTLFAQTEHAAPVFAAVLDKYYGGEQDLKTLELLNSVGHKDQSFADI